MPTISYPSYGNGGLTIDMWAKMYADADGIINDFHTNGVSALNLTLTGDIARIGPGTVQVNGYDMEVTGTTDLSAPAVVATTTYYITALYDPALNVAAADGSANPLGPVRLTITSGAPASGGGRSWCTQYRI